MIINNDCLDEMRKMEDNSISCIVTDPPYGLHFMGKDWDKFKKTNFDERGDWNTAIENGKERIVRKIASANAHSGTYDETRNDEFQEFVYQFGLEALRIVKPGGHILMFGAPRRYHRQVSGLEDAGWEIRDCLMWIFGSGFPKSHNMFGLPGYGTALKPAYEPIIMAMKPCDGTFKENAEKWGQAGINIEACRIGNEERPVLIPTTCRQSNSMENPSTGATNSGAVTTKGRWPANVMFDEEAAKMLDEQSGQLKSIPFSSPSVGFHDCLGRSKKLRKDGPRGFTDSGGASRFFYCAKTSSRERNEGLEGMALKDGGIKNDSGRGFSESDPHKSIQYRNNHPTVKPLKLMRYLITLIMPPKDGILLDPFAGSGSTILAAHQLGLKAIGIEKSAEYCEIARKRIESWKPEKPSPDLFDPAMGEE